MPRVKKDRFRRQEVQEAMESVQDAVDELEVMIQAPMGTLKFGGGDNTEAKFGDMVVVDPTSGVLTVSLPSLNETKQGMSVTVINNSNSANTITIAAADGDTINGAGTRTIGAMYDWLVCICTGPHSWVAK